MRMNSVHNQIVERSLKRHIRNLPFLQVQLRSAPLPAHSSKRRHMRRATHSGQDRRQWRSLYVIKGLRARGRIAQRVARQARMICGARRRRARLALWRHDRRERWREVRRGTKKADDGRVAMVQLRHSVEEVRDEARSEAHGVGRDVSGCNADDEMCQLVCQK